MLEARTWLRMGYTPNEDASKDHNRTKNETHDWAVLLPLALPPDLPPVMLIDFLEGKVKVDDDLLELNWC